MTTSVYSDLHYVNADISKLQVNVRVSDDLEFVTIGANGMTDTFTISGKVGIAESLIFALRAAAQNKEVEK